MALKRVDVRGVGLAYLERGSGDETVVLAHSYLVDHRQFEAQIETLADRYRVVAYDHREHGASDRTPGPYELDDLVADAVGLIDATGSGPCHFVGLSVGGFVALRLALVAPDRLRSLTVMDSSAELEPAGRRIKYEAMFLLLKALGYRPLMPSVSRIMFGPAMRRDPARRDELALWRRRIMDNDRDALVRFGRAIFRRDAVAPRLGEIDLPTLVIVGADDRAQPPARSRVIADGIPGATLAVVPGAGHLATVDAPAAVTETLLRFLDRLAEKASAPLAQ